MNTYTYVSFLYSKLFQLFKIYLKIVFDIDKFKMKSPLAYLKCLRVIYLIFIYVTFSYLSVTLHACNTYILASTYAQWRIRGAYEKRENSTTIILSRIYRDNFSKSLTGLVKLQMWLTSAGSFAYFICNR